MPATAAPSPNGRPMPVNRRRDRLLAGALFASAVLAYFPALQGGRLLDDDLHITRPELQSIGGLGRIWFEVGATQQYYPALHTAFWVEHRLWGDAPIGYHLITVLLHASAALCVVGLMRRLRLPGAWFAAFAFALHPVCVESVAWIAEQKNTLSTVLALGATLAYLHFDQDRRASRYWLAFGLFALALLSKTAVVTLPAALLVVLWWQRPRLAWRRDVRPLLLWLALGGLVSLITFSVEHRLLAGIAANFTLTPVERVLLAGRVFWFYVGKFAWPVSLAFFYPRWAIDAADVGQWLYSIAAAALAAGLGYVARSRRGPLAAFLCFAALLAPVLGFFNVEWFVFSYVADHLQYLAILALIVPLAGALAAAAGRLSLGRRRIAGTAAIACLSGLGALTWRQCGRYQDAVTFYRVTAESIPGSAVAHNHLGAALAAVPGRMPEAIAEFETALRLDPHFGEIQENLGTALLADPARRAEAIAHLETARRLRPDRKTAHDKLAFALSTTPGRLPEAIAEFQASLQIDPTDPLVHEGLGLALTSDPDRRPEAEAELRAALRLSPGLALAHFQLGTLLAGEPGRQDEAAQEYESFLRTQPDSADGHYNLGNLLLRISGRAEDGIAHLSEAVRLRPDFAEAQNNLGIALLNFPDRLPDAIAHLEAALRARPAYAEAENNLGIAIGHQPGKIPAAIAHFEAALRIDPTFTPARDNLRSAQQYLQQTPSP
jgi:tetratricopeptide (TPR) repeat protein